MVAMGDIVENKNLRLGRVLSQGFSNFEACFGTCSADQANLELFLSSAEIKGVYHHLAF